MNNALHQIKILDMTRYLPGGYTTQAFADLGADVLKVEEIDKGDFCRGDAPKINDISYYFTALCRNKRSLSLNLKAPEGKELFLKLAEQADVIVENFRPGVTKRLGIDYASLKAINPRLIYCSLSAFGQEHPDSLKAIHDINLQALSGYLSVNGGKNTPLHLADVATGMVAIQGILLALFQRTVDGTGRYVDVSMFDAFSWWLSLIYSRFHFQGNSVTADTLEYPAFCYNVYTTKDGGKLAFGMVEDKFWREFCTANGLEEFIPKQFLRRFEDEAGWQKLCDFVASRTLAEWLDWLKGRDICITPALSVQEAVQQQTAAKNPMLAYNTYPGVGSVLQTGLPIRVSGLEVSVQDATPPPPLGADNAETLTELGYSAASIVQLMNMGVIGKSRTN